MPMPLTVYLFQVVIWGNALFLDGWTYNLRTAHYEKCVGDSCREMDILPYSSLPRQKKGGNWWTGKMIFNQWQPSSRNKKLNFADCVLSFCVFAFIASVRICYWSLRCFYWCSKQSERFETMKSKKLANSLMLRVACSERKSPKCANAVILPLSVRWLRGNKFEVDLNQFPALDGWDVTYQSAVKATCPRCQNAN